MNSSNHLAYGVWSHLKFGEDGSLLSFGRNKPLLTMPFGPPQPWLMAGHEGAASAIATPNVRFGSKLSDRKVNQSGYLSLWNSQPRSLAPSWNPLLLQGSNVFQQGGNSPNLSDVVPVSSFGRRKLVRKVGKVTKKRSVKKTTKKPVKKRN